MGKNNDFFGESSLASVGLLNTLKTIISLIPPDYASGLHHDHTLLKYFMMYLFFLFYKAGDTHKFSFDPANQERLFLFVFCLVEMLTRLV